MSLPVIETERLILRPLVPEDAEAMFVWAGDERVTKYLSYTTYTSAEQLREMSDLMKQRTDIGLSVIASVTIAGITATVPKRSKR